MEYIDNFKYFLEDLEEGLEYPYWLVIWNKVTHEIDSVHWDEDSGWEALSAFECGLSYSNEWVVLESYERYQRELESWERYQREWEELSQTKLMNE